MENFHAKWEGWPCWHRGRRGAVSRSCKHPKNCSCPSRGPGPFESFKTNLGNRNRMVKGLLMEFQDNKAQMRRTQHRSHQSTGLRGWRQNSSGNKRDKANQGKGRARWLQGLGEGVGNEFNGDAFQSGKMKAVDGGVSCPLRICLVCIPTNSLRGFPFLHTLSSIYCL